MKFYDWFCSNISGECGDVVDEAVDYELIVEMRREFRATPFETLIPWIGGSMDSMAVRSFPDFVWEILAPTKMRSRHR